MAKAEPSPSQEPSSTLLDNTRGLKANALSPNAEMLTTDLIHNGIERSLWSIQDDEVLLQAREQGHNWDQIALEYFPSRTAFACRLRHEDLMKRRNPKNWDEKNMSVLAEAYMKVRQDMWSILAERVNGKWQELEQMFMEKGMKILAQANQAASNGTVKGRSCNLDDTVSIMHPDAGTAFAAKIN